MRCSVIGNGGHWREEQEGDDFSMDFDKACSKVVCGCCLRKIALVLRISVVDFEVVLRLTLCHYKP